MSVWYHLHRPYHPNGVQRLSSGQGLFGQCVQRAVQQSGCGPHKADTAGTAGYAPAGKGRKTGRCGIPAAGKSRLQSE